MTSPSQPLELEIHPHRARTKRSWRRAFAALRGLLREPDETRLAFEIIRALDPDIHARTLARMLAHPEGRRTFAERPSLRAALTDRNALRNLPEGSFGRAYLAHLERYGLEPDKLIELGRSVPSTETADADTLWMGERSQLTHDLWHVLSGIGADPHGEAALLLFSLAQAGGTANVLLSLGATLHVLRERGPRWIPYAWTAWRRGRRARCLHALPYEKLLPMPLEEVRAAAGIEVATG